MQVFISWSGPVSRQVAELFRDWLPSVLQLVTPFVSSEDIDKGARWSPDIARQLEEANFGIVCVTPENVTAPWLNFEAGALSKAVDVSRVLPFLVGLDRAAVTGPLLQFQSTVFQLEDVQRLVRTLNAACATQLPAERINEVFAMWWPKFEERLRTIEAQLVNSAQPHTGPPARSERSMLEELLELVRSQHRMLNRSDATAGTYAPAAADDVGTEVLDGVRELAVHWREAYYFSTNYNEMDTARVQALRRLIYRMLPPLERAAASLGVSQDLRAIDTNRETARSLMGGASGSNEDRQGQPKI